MAKAGTLLKSVRGRHQMRVTDKEPDREGYKDCKKTARISDRVEVDGLSIIRVFGEMCGRVKREVEGSYEWSGLRMCGKRG